MARNRAIRRCLAWATLSAAVMTWPGCRSVESRPAQLNEAAGASNAPSEAKRAAEPATLARTTRTDAGPSGSDKFAFSKSKDEVTAETKYQVNLEACDLEATVKSDGTELIVVRHADCRLPMAEYAELWRQLLAAAINDVGFVGQKIHLVWGRIASPESDSMAPVISRRLASSVRRAPAWDTKSGTVSHGLLNEFVREHAQPADIFPELVRVAQALGFSAETEHVEKVLVGTPENWPGTKTVGFGSDDKLPYDAQIVFVLTRLSN